MFPKYDKCIYIDADTVIPGDISRLYNEDLNDNYLGCIVDKLTINNEILASYLNKLSASLVTYILIQVFYL